METINNVATAAAKAVWGEGDAQKEPVSGVKGDVSRGEPYDAGNLDAEDQEKVEKRLSNDGNEKGSDKPTATIATDTTADTTSGQNDIRHPAKAATDPEPVDPENLKGAGPKPIDVVAREHGGDAGQHVEKSTQFAEPEPKEEQKKEEANSDGQDYVRATGFAAEGGNFDAKNPGAGREADRLLEEKGVVHHDDKATSSQPATDANNSKTDPAKSKHAKNKPSLSERIKAKLHRH